VLRHLKAYTGGGIAAQRIAAGEGQRETEEDLQVLYPKF
jgi:hypothetical protein